MAFVWRERRTRFRNGLGKEVLFMVLEKATRSMAGNKKAFQERIAEHKAHTQVDYYS